MRTIIEVPDGDIQSLDRIGEAEGRARAALIREAIADYLKVKSLPAVDAAFGLWESRNEDGLSYQIRLRKEWGTE